MSAARWSAPSSWMGKRGRSPPALLPLRPRTLDLPPALAPGRLALAPCRHLRGSVLLLSGAALLSGLAMQPFLALAHL